MVLKLPYKIYNRPFAKNHRSIQCDTCDIWVHCECNKINKQTYKLLQNEKNTKWFCIICTEEFLLFFSLNNEEFIHTLKGKKVSFTHVDEKQ